MTYARRMLGMQKPTWRSDQKREEQAKAEAATAMAVEEPDFATGQAHEEQGSDVADEDIDRARADDDSAIAEPESEPDNKHREPKRKEGADDKCSDEDSADDAALPAEEDALPVLPQVSRPQARGIQGETGASFGAAFEANRRRVFHWESCADADSPALERLSLRTLR